MRHVALGCHHPCSPGDEITFVYLGLTRSKTGNTGCGASHCFVLRSQVCPRAGQSNESSPCFQSAVPGGTEVIKPQFGLAETFYEGLAPIRKDGKWGFIDKSGNVAINPYSF